MGNGLWFVGVIILGVAWGQVHDWTEQTDPWFLDGLGMDRMYWRDANTGRLWLPNTPDPQKPPRGFLACQASRPILMFDSLSSQIRATLLPLLQAQNW